MVVAFVRYQLLSYGATSEVEYCDELSSSGLDFCYCYICKWRSRSVDGISQFWCLDIGMAATFAELFERSVTLDLCRVETYVDFFQGFIQGVVQLGSKLLISRTVDAIYSSGSFLLIGKFFLPTVTGLYSQSIQMTSLMPQTITDIIARGLSHRMNCKTRKKSYNSVFSRCSMACFVLFPLNDGSMALVEPAVRLLLTEKWMAVCPLIQILCFAWIWRPASHMNWQLLNAKHRSDYCLKAEIIKKSIAIVLLVIMLFFGIKAVCFGVLAYFIVDVYVMTRFTRRILSQVTFMEEMRNLLPILLQAMLMGVLVHFLKYLIYSDLLLIVSGIFVGITLYAGISIVSGSGDKDAGRNKKEK